MTSLLSSYKLGNTLPNPTSCRVCVYSDGTNVVPVPFTFDRRTSTLDMRFSPGFTNSTDIITSAKYFRGQTFGTLYTIDSIGPNFIEWLETPFPGGGADAGSVTIWEKPIVVPANVVQVDLNPVVIDSTGTSANPISFELANGGPSNEYYATYLFQKPLVVKYTKGGGAATEYRAFLTKFSEGV